MRRSSLGQLSALAFSFLLTSCATQYGERTLLSPGGYRDSRIDDTHYIVSFDGNGHTDRARVWNYWMYRCAELTREKGYAYFSIQAMNAVPPRGSYDDRLPLARVVDREGAGFIKTHGGGGFVYVPGGGTATVTTYHSKAIVSLYREAEEAQTPFVLRAQAILDDLGPYVKANGAAPLVPQEDLVRHALVFTPNAIVLTDTHLDATLPDGWDRRPLTVPMIESGTLLYAINPSMSAGMTLTALRRDKVSDPLGYISNRRALLLAGLVGSEASEVATLEIGGRRAFQFDVTGILGSGQKVTFIVTLIEGQGEIALLNRWVSAADYGDNKAVMADLASAVMGFSEATRAAASGPGNGATPAAAAPPMLGTPPAALPAPGAPPAAPPVPAPAAPTEKQS